MDDLESIVKCCRSILNDMRPISPCLTEQFEEQLDKIAAIALMRGQSEDRPKDAIDDDNGFRRYPWTYQNQPGNVGAWALGESASKAKPGGDPIDHGLSLLRELHLRGLGIVRVPKLKDTADEQ